MTRGRNHRVMGRLLRLEFLLWAGGLLLLSYFFFHWIGRKYSQQRLEAKFEAEMGRVRSHESVEKPAPSPAVRLSEGDPVGRIEVPSVGLEAMIVEGVSERALRQGVGHFPRTALPGGSGRVALAAHRDTFFRPLAGIRVGDEIVLTTAAGSQVYRVSRTEIVTPENASVVAPGGDPALTLVTCYPFHYVGHAPKRFIVHARPVERRMSSRRN